MTKAASATVVGFLLLAHAAGSAADGPTYKYRDDDGTVWFTDRPASGADFDRMEFIGYHGRPPARHSCGELTEAELAERSKAIATPLGEYTARFDVDYDLARAIITVESCFDARAVSRVGAQGLMQLMPATAEQLGVDDSFDIHQNLRAGLQYFRELKNRFGGDPVRALAAYNAGPDAVERHDGVPPYDETQRYVDRVLEHWSDYRAASID